MTERQRLLELAIKGLEAEQARVQDEIRLLRQELNGGAPKSAAAPAKAAAPASARRSHPNKGRRLSAAHRKKIAAAQKARYARERETKAKA